MERLFKTFAKSLLEGKDILPQLLSRFQKSQLGDTLKTKAKTEERELSENVKTSMFAHRESFK